MKYNEFHYVLKLIIKSDKNLTVNRFLQLLENAGIDHNFVGILAREIGECPDNQLQYALKLIWNDFEHSSRQNPNSDLNNAVILHWVSLLKKYRKQSFDETTPIKNNIQSTDVKDSFSKKKHTNNLTGENCTEENTVAEKAVLSEDSQENTQDDLRDENRKLKEKIIKLNQELKCFKDKYMESEERRNNVIRQFAALALFTLYILLINILAIAIYIAFSKFGDTCAGQVLAVVSPCLLAVLISFNSEFKKSIAQSLNRK